MFLLNVFITLSLLSCSGSTKERAPSVSLWGNVADFTKKCSHWRLERQVLIPALQEFTVCLNLKFEVQPLSPWTAFMYRHPDVQHAELGFGGKQGRFVVWLFGREWSTGLTKLNLSRWYMLCFTWTHTKDRPTLYINGNPEEVTAAPYADTAPCTPTSSCKLAPNGTLTLGAAHQLVHGSIQIVPIMGLLGQLSLFRLWRREWSQQEVTSLNCTEGDLVKWWRNDWDTQTCAPLPDSSLRCEWSFYEVTVSFVIIRLDGNHTEDYAARDTAHQWLRDVLPASIYLHRVSVFEVASSSTEDSFVKTTEPKDKGVWWIPPYKRFGCLVHVTVTPAEDVAVMQSNIYVYLKNPYPHPNGHLQLLTDEESIHTTAVERFSTTTVSPTDVVTESPSATTTITSTSASTSAASATTVTSSTASATTVTSSAASATTVTSSAASATTVTSSAASATTFTSSTASATTITSSAASATTVTSSAASATTFTSSAASATTVTSSAASATTVTSSAASATTFTSSAANISDLYFEVMMNVSITGESDTEQILSIWLNSSLPDDTMILLDLHLLPRSPGPYSNLKSDLSAPVAALRHGISRASCVFQVQVTVSLSDTQEMEEQIRDLLLMPYNDGSISIATEDIQIRRIFIVNCNAETITTKKGTFQWPVTDGGKNATQPCPKNAHCYATRHCKLSITTHWLPPDLGQCSLLVESIPDLDPLNVTAENAPDVVELIEDLLSKHSKLTYDELLAVLNKLKDVVNLSEVTPTMGQALIDIISNILQSDSNLLPFTNTILNITDAVGDKIVGYEGSQTLVAPALAISVVDVDPGDFSTLTFSVLSGHVGAKPEIFINRHPSNSTVAFISLPSTLQHSFPQNSWNPTPARIMFQFYGIPALFMSNEVEQTLNTFVVSASVTNASSPIKGLDEDVKIVLQHLAPNTLDKDVQCVYWNFNKNNEQGGWDDDGCRQFSSVSNYTTCLCDHLTHFGVLLDMSRTQVDTANEQILTIITYIGCGVSSLFLGITVLTYTAFEKLRRDYPSQILINLSLALLGLNLVFLVNSWLASWELHGLCMAVAAMLQYFLLASFTWMGLEAVNMYFALVKVFNVYVPSYILKFCVLGWGIPLVICSLVFIVNREAYGSHLYLGSEPGLEPLGSSDNFCWLQDNMTFYVSVVAYAVLVFLFNVAVFVVVLIQIRRMRFNSPAGTRSSLMHDLKGVASLTLLLGLTWIVGFFTWGPARIFLLYIFSGLNSLQGLFIFLFHCLMKENVRKQWRIHLCFGRFRLDEYSEWSNSASVGAAAKLRSNPPSKSVPSVHSVKSSSTDSTSASSESSQRDSSSKRPNLGLFVNSLALPRAQRSISGTGAVPTHRGINQTPGWRNHWLGQQEQR